MLASATGSKPVPARLASIPCPSCEEKEGKVKGKKDLSK